MMCPHNIDARAYLEDGNVTAYILQRLNGGGEPERSQVVSLMCDECYDKAVLKQLELKGGIFPYREWFMTCPRQIALFKADPEYRHWRREYFDSQKTELKFQLKRVEEQLQKLEKGTA